MGAAAVGVMAAGTLLNTYGAMEQGRAARDAAENDARIAERNSLLAREQAREQETRFRASARKQIASMTAGYAASGVTMEGSPTEVLQESIANAEADALQIRRGGEIRSQAFRDEAASSRSRGRAAERLGTINSTASLFSGAVRVGDRM